MIATCCRAWRGNEPGDYYELFLAEKERLKKLSKQELERELGVRKKPGNPVA